ncbi:LOW QUALITY PROTEIN: uncharacterized protein [Diadema setosum]|uniref:LOW QUALITY PROTEIN: uncharacterized protein n=1 Tax=Diadema setosum TaxID=31175 RepID=UPI003B3AECBC
MNVKCLEEMPLAKLVGGPSPLDGLVVVESDIMCFEGFNPEAADLVCRELGFRAVKDYTAEIIPTTAPSDNTQWLSYSTGCQRATVNDCLSNKTECSWNKAVRLRCQEPGFLGCYRDDRRSFQALFVSGFSVHSDEECVSTCRRKSGNHDIAIINERNCTCYQSEAFANFISDVSSAHDWAPETSEELKPGQQIHCLFNLSVGFCEHPGPVSDGYWDSNITSFGSKMTLTCGEGFILSGTATLQCVGLPGWSTCFPVWNASVPSCRAVDNATNDKERHDVEILTTPSQMTVSPSELQPVEELTTLQKTVTSSVSGHHQIDIMVGLYTLGTFLFVVLTLLVILSVAWYKHHKKRYRPSQVSNQLLQMHPVHSSNQNPSSTDNDVFNTDGAGVEEEGHPYPNHPDNTFRDAMAHGEDTSHMRHIYQDAAETHTGASLPSNVEQVSRAFSSRNNDNKTVGCGSLPSANIPYIQDFNDMQGTSLDHTENGSEECVYQDVELNSNNGVTEDASRSPGGARLFDDTCYNSLNFSSRSDGYCTQMQDARLASGKLENDYARSRNILRDNDHDHINHTCHDDRAQGYDPAHPSICPTFQPNLHANRKENLLCSSLGSPTGAPSEGVFYYKLDPGVSQDIEAINRPYHPDVFDRSEYSSLNPGKDSIGSLLPDVREFDHFSESHDTKTPIREELYTRVNKPRGTALPPKPVICEELYAKVDKSRKTCSVDAKTPLPDGLYAELKETKGHSPSANPAVCEGLYANVDKTGDSCITDIKPNFDEEMYMNFTDI